jgi:sugar phosphate permease
MFLPANVLFGNAAGLNARPRSFEYYNEVDEHDENSAEVENAKPEGLLGFLFGFMFEEEALRDPDSLDDEILRVKVEGEPAVPIWNPLNISLFMAYALTTAATSVLVTLIPAMNDELNENSNQQIASAFATRVATHSVLGTAFGKFTLSCMGDICGARRTAVVCSILTAVSLLGLSTCQTANAAFWACFFVDFFQSVQWPCIIVVLATHYRRHGNAAYEGGIFVTSLASRFGVLVGIPTSSMILRISGGWRLVAVVGAWAALVASSIHYLFVNDSEAKQNDPQNPINPQLLAIYRRKQPSLANSMAFLGAIFQSNVAPSLKHVLKSPVFYIVAIAHTGSSAVRTSERILGSYYLDTSLNTLSENRAGGLAVFLSLGTIMGLIVAGRLFTKGTERERKRLVTKLYLSTIASCYILAILAIPRLRTTLNAPSLVLIFQVMATFAMGFSIAVQLCQIPSLVGATFGCDKGMYAGYTDGVAYALSSMVWRIVGNSVQGDGFNGAGWAYGWAAVALMLIISAIFMVEFMEHYFVRPGARTTGRYETIMFA